MSADLVIAVHDAGRYADGDPLEIFTVENKAELMRAKGARSRGRPHEDAPDPRKPRPSHPRWHQTWLWLRIENPSAEEAAKYLAPAYGPDELTEEGETVPGAVLLNRRYTVPWRSLPGMTEGMIQRIENPSVQYDPREELPVYRLATICIAKG